MHDIEVTRICDDEFIANQRYDSHQSGAAMADIYGPLNAVEHHNGNTGDGSSVIRTIREISEALKMVKAYPEAIPYVERFYEDIIKYMNQHEVALVKISFN